MLQSGPWRGRAGNAGDARMRGGGGVVPQGRGGKRREGGQDDRGEFRRARGKEERRGVSDGADVLHVGGAVGVLAPGGGSRAGRRARRGRA